jgi:hypothetical protein
MDFDDGHVCFLKHSSKPIHPSFPPLGLLTLLPFSNIYPLSQLQTISNWPQPKHTTTHSIHTSGSSLSTHACHLSPSQLTITKETFQELEQLGIIQWSSSLWSTPFHMLPKPNGPWRPCEIIAVFMCCWPTYCTYLLDSCGFSVSVSVY